MKTVTLTNGEKVPALGQGTWTMGEHRDRRADEISALREGVELGMTLIDTAEMYGEGAAETLIGETWANGRDWERGSASQSRGLTSGKHLDLVSCDRAKCNLPLHGARDSVLSNGGGF